jgi:3-oxoacyl-[acyl-carrier protein] reductase
MNAQNYVVVGGSKGIGLGIVERLLADGHQVTVLSRSAEGLGGKPNVVHHVFDAMKDDVSPGLLPEVIHGLAYCPGSLNLKPFSRMKLEEFRDDFELHVIGAIRVLQAAVPALKAATYSSVLLFSTVAVQQGIPSHTSISTAKGAVEGLVRSLAADLSPQIRVNCIAPALTQTALTSRFFTDPDRAKTYGEKYALARTGTVDDLASFAHFLLGPASSWMTGQVIGVDGGMSVVRK